ncbi:MAG TPA: hypothetical protein VKU61_13600 [Candidatus Binatia bacterium]|nr:hypothetical protein [Candidatus Binatia bacterium]
MAEQSHREEMSAAIRAQRERQAVPRSIAPSDDAPAPQPPPPVAEDEPDSRRRLFDRLRGK